MSMLMFVFWHYKQHQKWQFLNSNIYMWHASTCSEGDAQNQWLWSISFLMSISLAETRCGFEKATWISWNSLPQNSPHWTQILVQTLGRKRITLSPRTSFTKSRFDLQKYFSMKLSKSLTMQQSSLETTGGIRNKFPINHRVHMQEVLDLVANLQWPATNGSSCCNQSA